MPRKPRVISSTGIYHITLRSINQHIIFEEESDFQKFLFILADCKQAIDIDIYAYCLMNNHIHLLLHSSSNNLASFFQSLGSRFVRWYNNKYSRSGHLFQDRFFSVPIETESQYLSTLLYIHNNPVKANICHFESEYRWSSYNAFYDEKNPLINVSYSYDIAGSKDLLQKYFATNHAHSNDSSFSQVHIATKHYVPDEKALAIFKSITQLSSAAEVINLTKTARNNYIRILHDKGLTQKQLARLMDVSLTTVKRVCQSEK